jgi:hypothetical protein
LECAQDNFSRRINISGGKSSKIFARKPLSSEKTIQLHFNAMANLSESLCEVRSEYEEVVTDKQRQAGHYQLLNIVLITVHYNYDYNFIMVLS